MKKNSILSLLAICAVLMMVTSCATKKKYGCPNKISIEKLLGF